MTAKQTTERRPLLGRRFLIIKIRLPLLGNRSVNMFPRQRIRIREWTVLSALAVRRNYKEDNWGNQVNSVRESEQKIQWHLKSQLKVRLWKQDFMYALSTVIFRVTQWDCCNYLYLRVVKTPSRVTQTRDSTLDSPQIKILGERSGDVGSKCNWSPRSTNPPGKKRSVCVCSAQLKWGSAVLCLKCSSVFLHLLTGLQFVLQKLYVLSVRLSSKINDQGS
jgi:hypothetical protein